MLIISLHAFSCKNSKFSSFYFVKKWFYNFSEYFYSDDVIYMKYKNSISTNRNYMLINAFRMFTKVDFQKWYDLKKKLWSIFKNFQNAFKGNIDQDTENV